MIVAITGHREEKLKIDKAEAKEILRERLVQMDAHKVIVGMANGIDLYAAEVAEELGLDLVCARPWAGHTPRVADKEAYERALAYASLVVNVDPSEEYAGPWVYQKRNEWMVNHANSTLAIWNGSPGGTANCVKYAEKLGRPMLIVNPE